MNILITGATGFLGERLVQQLKEDGEHHLYGLSRRESSAQTLESWGVTPVRADLTDEPSLTRAMGEIEINAVFHLAAEIASQRSRSKLRNVNIRGTRNLISALKGHPGIEKFVFVSTVVTGEAGGKLLKEDVPLVVHTEYGRTKQTAERLLLDAFEKYHLPVVIVRPSHIYGNGGWFRRIIEGVGNGALRIPGDGKNLWDMVHVDDVASALITALHRGENGQIYHVADDTPVTMNEVVEAVAKLTGRDTPVGHAPALIAGLIHGRDAIRSVVRSARTSNEKMKSLGWKPKHPDVHSGLASVFRERQGVAKV